MLSIYLSQNNHNCINFQGRNLKIQDVELFKKLVEDGLSNPQLAKEFNVARSTVIAMRKQLGLPSMRQQKFDKKVNVVLEKLTSSDKQSRQKIAKELGIGKGSIDKIAQQYNIFDTVRTNRDNQIMGLLSQGFTTAQIAQKLDINASTVSRTFSRLGVRLKKPSSDTDVLAKLAEGKKNKQIAEELGLREQTICVIKKKYGLVRKYNRLEPEQNIKWEEIAEESKHITALRKMYMNFKKGERTPEILEDMLKTIEHLKDVVLDFKKRL